MDQEPETPTSVRLSEISISESRFDDFRQVNRISNESDFASYFALTRISKKIQDSSIISNEPRAKKMKDIYQQLKWIRKFVLIVYATMTIFQKPIWCNSHEYNNNCQRQIIEDYEVPTFISFYIPVYAYYTIEISLLIFLVIFKFFKVLSFSIITNSRKHITLALIIVGSIIILNDIIVMILDNDYKFNISTLLKPIFIILYSLEFQSVIIDFAEIIYRGKEIYFLMIFSYVFFVGLGTAIFRDQYEIDDFQKNSGICNSSGLPFNQLNYCTFLIMFQLQTTVNSPDIYLPYYGNRSIAVVYFISYQFINTILMINLILSLFYSQYKSLVEKRTKFLLENNSKKIDQYHKKLFQKRRGSFVQLINQKLSNYNKPLDEVTQKIMDNWIFKIIMQLISLLDFCLIFQDNTEFTIQIINLVFNLILLIESIIKLITYGFMKSSSTLYNFIISIVLSALIISEITLQNYFITQNIIIKICCSLMSLRLFRGCAWLLKSDNFTKILIKIISISSYLLQLFGTLIVVMTIFTSIGQLVFGGKINYSSAHIQNYQWVNYNDFLSGFCTCWFLLIVNNWNVMSYDFSLSLQSNYIYIFFIFYYIIVVLLAQSVTIALLIEYLVNQVKELSSDEKESQPQYHRDEETSIDLNTPLKFDFKKEL